MVMKFLKALFASSARAETPAPTAYRQFLITASPRKTASGWQVAGTISCECEGARVERSFLRADCCASRDDAVAIALQKARQIVDQFGADALAKFGAGTDPL